MIARLPEDGLHEAVPKKLPKPEGTFFTPEEGAFLESFGISGDVWEQGFRKPSRKTTS